MKRRVAWVLSAVVAFWAVSPNVLAQSSAVPGSPAAEIPESDLTIERISSRIDQIKQSTDLDEQARTPALTAYEEAANDLRLTAEWTAKLAAFAKEREAAPGGIEQIRAELAAPVDDKKVEAPVEATLAQLEQLLAQADAGLKNLREQLKAMDDELAARPQRMAKLTEDIAKTRQELAGLLKAAEAPPVEGESPVVTAARKTARASRRRLLETRIKAMEEDAARGELLTALRDRAARETQRAENIAQSWQVIVNDRRKGEAEAAAAAAKTVQEEAARSHPAVAAMAEANAALAKERTELVERIEKTTAEISRVTKQLEELRDRSTFVTSKSEAAGLTIEVGPLLLQAREQLGDLREMRKKAAKRRTEMSTVAVRQIELGNARRGIGDLDARVRECMKQLDPRPSEAQRPAIESAIRELLAAQIELLDKLKSDHETQGKSLVSLLEQQELLIQSTESFADYVDEHILWVRSTDLPGRDTPAKLMKALLWLTNAKQWRQTTQSLVVSSVAAPVSMIGGLLIFAALASFRRRMGLRMIQIGKAAGKSQAMRFTPTIEALVLTFLVSALWPFLLWFAGARWSAPYDASEFAKALGLALQTAAQVLLAVEFMRQVCRPNGLAEAHFGWSAKPLRILRRSLSLLAAGGLPALLVVLITLHWTRDASHLNSLGRAAFVAGMLMTAVFIRRVLRPTSATVREAIAHHPTGPLARFRHAGYGLAMVMPWALMMLSIAGYHYTALQMARRLQLSVWLVLTLVMLSALALRGLMVSKRRIAMDQARQRRAAELAERAEREARGEAAESAEKSAAADVVQEPMPDLSSIGAQTMTMLRASIGLAFLLGIWAIWVDVVPALAILDRVELWQAMITTTVQETAPDGAATVREVERLAPVTLADLGLAIIILLGMFVGARNIPGLLEIVILQRLPLKSAERYAITTVARYVITIAGLATAFSLLGVGWAKVQWLAAAITVGLGFGLQEIFANFVSGLIVLFEQPIRVGDIVTVGDLTGTVTRIRMRATTIVDPNRKELVVPNKEFVTGKIINWSLSDKILRIVVRLGVAYGTDTVLARRILLDEAKRNPRVLDDPAPTSHFTEFGAGALMLELRAFVSGIEDWTAAGDELRTAIDAAFKKASIEIAVDQLDVNIRRLPENAPRANP